MSVTTTCDNARRTCDPCTCPDCSSGEPRLGDLERRVIDVRWGEPGYELNAPAGADAIPGSVFTTVTTVLDWPTHKS
jgi:hypothetical protein